MTYSFLRGYLSIFYIRVYPGLVFRCSVNCGVARLLSGEANVISCVLSSCLYNSRPAIMCCTCVLSGFVKLLSLRKHFFLYLFPEHQEPEHLLGCFVPNGMVNTADVLLPVCFYMK